MESRMRITLFLVACLATTGALLLRGDAQQTDESIGIPEGIVWYGVLADGLAEAKETGKPIFLLSAAPNCTGVSGIW